MSFHFEFILLLIGIGAILIGLAAVALPQRASQSFGIKVYSEALPYVQATGARDIFLGITLLILYWRNDFLTAGYVCVAIACVSIVDAYVTWRNGSKPHSLFHVAGTVGVVAYGIWLISTAG